MERRIEMSSERERIPRLRGGGASVSTCPLADLGWNAGRAAGKGENLDRTSLLRQLTVRHGDTAFNWPVTREVAEAQFRPALFSRK